MWAERNILFRSSNASFEVKSNGGARSRKIDKPKNVICEMAIRLGGSPKPGEVLFDFAITQTQLADATGLTSVHVNRTLQSLRADQIVEWSRGNVVRIPHWDSLAAAGDFDPEYLQTRVKPQDRPHVVAVA